MSPERWFYTIPLRIRSFFERSAADNNLDDEIQFHLEQKTKMLVGRGLNEEEARYAARREFHGVEQSKESCRDQRKVNWFQDFTQDFRFAARMLRKNLVFTSIAVLTLALGIGANTAIFSVVQAVLVRPLPYPDANRLAIIFSAWGGESRGPASGPEVIELRRRSKLFDEIAGIWVTTGTIEGSAEPEQIRVAQVTPNFLNLLARQPQLGSFFSNRNEHGAVQPVTIITDSLWRRQFGVDPSIVGKTIRLGPNDVTVIGVMASDFRLIFPSDVSVPPDVDAFVPFGESLAKASPSTGYIRILGRLHKGATFAQAQAEADSISAQLRSEYKDFGERNLRLYVFSLQADAVRNVRSSLLVLFGGVGLVLLIACVNVANLLLSRSSARTREITVRTALGAGPSRIIRQMLTESVLLSSLGGVIALGVGRGALRWLLSLRPEGIARIGSIGLDFPVLAFTAAISIVAGVMFGLAPAMKAAKLNVAEALKEGGRSSTDRKAGSRNLLIVSEVALGFVLLVGSGLMIRTFISLLRVDPGFRGENVLTFQLSIPRPLLYPPSGADRFLQDLRANLAALPSVQSVGIVSHMPLDASASNWYSYFWPEGTPPKDQKTIMADYRSTSPGYFQSIGATIISGRDFTELDDVAHTHVAIVDDDLAQLTWPNQNPIGKKLVVEDSPGGPFWFIEDTVEVVGVVRHVQYHSLTKSVRSQIYVPFALAPRPLISFVVRSAIAPESLVGSVRNEVAKLNKGLPVSHVVPLADYLRAARSDARFITMLAIVLAVIALLLACIGIYGVTSYAVQQRTSQIGVRMALGAQPADVMKMILRQGMAPVGLGAFAGTALSFALTPLLSSLLYGVRPTDFFTIGLSHAILLVAGIAACYLPARRATKVDPIVALRYD